MDLVAANSRPSESIGHFRRRRVTRTLLLGLSIAPLGCVGSGTAAGAFKPGIDWNVADSTDPADGEAFALFASTFELHPYGDESDRALHRIIQFKIQECMTAHGFGYVEYPFTPDWPAATSGRAMLPPLPTRDEVIEQGYDALIFIPEEFSPPSEIIDAARLTAEAQAANDGFAASSEMWTATLFGGAADTPEERGGCIVDAHQFVDERVGLDARARYSALAAGLVDITSKDLIIATGDADDALGRALQLWRGCMSESGYDYETPGEAGAAFPGVVLAPDGTEMFVSGPQSVPTDEEIAVAVADLECRVESGFRNALRDKLVANIEAWYDANAAAIAELRETTDRERREFVTLAEDLGIG